MNQNMHDASGTQPKFSPSNMKVRLGDATKECLRCEQIVMETMQYCIQQGGDHVDPHHLKLMQTCSEISRTAAIFMMLQSPFYSLTCDIASQVCRECAKSCSGLHDSVMKACAEVCLNCADICSESAGLRS